MTSTSLSKQVAIVVGGSRGLGREGSSRTLLVRRHLRGDLGGRFAGVPVLARRLEGFGAPGLEKSAIKYWNIQIHTDCSKMAGYGLLRGRSEAGRRIRSRSR